MSQAKVDRYKEDKRNRDKIIKKQKREWMLTKLGLSAVGLVMVAWIGVSVYNGITTDTTEETVERAAYSVDTTALNDYLIDLSTVEE